MLVLTLTEDERIMVGDDVVVVLIGIRDNKVRLGFDAPKSVSIDREKVRQSKLLGPRD